MSGDDTHHTAEIDPRYVLLGNAHLRSDDPVVRTVSFEVSDATVIFNDSASFAMALAPDPHQLTSIIEKDRGERGRKVEIGEQPMVAYYTGKREVFVAETVLGRISATHNVSFNGGRASGVGFNNRIKTRIAFPEPVTFNAVIDAVLTMSRFLEIIAGRRQTVMDMSLATEVGGVPGRLQVYWPLKPVRQEGGAPERLHPLQLPLDAARQPEAFADVLTRWLANDHARVAARAQFSDGFTKEHQYDTTRLIGAANMFDLLPPEASPPDQPLETDVASARDEARRVFRALPDSPERSMILSALGRVGKPVLKRKIRHRAATVTAALAEPLPHLDIVIDLAVEYRNILVHGSESDLDIAGPFGQMMPFLTNMLEFIFLASELIEAGWDARSWGAQRRTWDHPLGYALLGYDAYLRELDAALPVNRKFLTP